MLKFLLAMFLVSGVGRAVCQTPVLVQAAVAPHYPPIAVSARVSGEVVVLVKIGSDGAVILAETKSGAKMLEAAARGAAKQWKFEPSSLRERETLLHFNFVLLAVFNDSYYDVKFLPPYQVFVEMHPPKDTVNYGTSIQTSPPNDAGVSHEVPGHAKSLPRP